MAFTTPSYTLTDLFDRIHRGELQLPDFQRPYMWDVDRIRGLIVTVLRGYPIGAMLALDTRDEPVRFRSRSIAGAPEVEGTPGILLLDGQQRLTSLYHSFQGDGLVDTVDFRNKRIRRRFFVDVLKAVEGDVLPDEAVFTVNQSGTVTSHFAPATNGKIVTAADEVAAGCVPVDALLGQAGSDLLFDMAVAAKEPVREAIKRFHHRIVAPLAGYQIPMIRLGRETARSGVGAIFAHANSAGMPLDVVELLTAVFSAEDPSFSMAEEFAVIEKRLAEYPVLGGVDRLMFLQTLSLYASAQRGGAGGLREDILTLTLADWHRCVPDVLRGYEHAARFLVKKCIFTPQQVPYTSQLVPLATILALLGDDALVESVTVRDRLNLWFWCGVFGELYGSAAVMLRSARDVTEMLTWLTEADATDEDAAKKAAAGEDAAEEGSTGEARATAPKTVRDARFSESRLLSIDPDSAVWRGIYALLMARGALDWRTGKPFDPETIEELSPEFEFIFPLGWCERHGVDPVLAQSVLNRTPMGRRTAVVIAGNDPKRYLPRVQSKSVMEDAEFDTVLASHELDPELLHRSQAAEVFADRRHRVIGMIEYAIDRAVIKDVDAANLAGGAEGPNAFAE